MDNSEATRIKRDYSLGFKLQVVASAEQGDMTDKQAKPKDKEYNLADGPSLFLPIKPNGTKSC